MPPTAKATMTVKLDGSMFAGTRAKIKSAIKGFHISFLLFFFRPRKDRTAALNKEIPSTY